MGKIDISKIEGYDSMSVEDKLAALEAYTIPDPDYSGYVRKETFDKTASELAAKKKELKDRMTEEESRKLQEQEDLDKMKAELETLRKASLIASHKAKYLALGYDESLAEDTANALADGDLDKVFTNQQKHQTDLEKKSRVEALKATPKPGGDGGNQTLTLKDFKAMSLADRERFYREHPEEYKTLYTGGNE